MLPHPYRIPALVTAVAALLAAGTAALGGDTMSRQCAAVAFLGAAVCAAIGPRSALRWSVAAALLLLSAGQLLSIRGYAPPADDRGAWLGSYDTDALLLIPALLAFAVGLIFLPRAGSRRAAPAAIVAAVPVVLALTDVLTDLDELAWTGPLLIGTWPALTAMLLTAVILFLTVERAAASLWPAAGALILTVLTAWTYSNAADIWSFLWRREHSSAFLQLGAVISYSPSVSGLAAVLVILTLGAPVLLAWGLLRRPA
ncbi:hypothetical protein [Actinoplanes sp. NPDC089786]|uniref:hypothetical protein n=1 Tax=Actinoplanes sp. NPDC089786 TaxID=3155185 RepID=UPI00341B778C